jgi:hypothetical protein
MVTYATAKAAASQLVERIGFPVPRWLSGIAVEGDEHVGFRVSVRVVEKPPANEAARIPKQIEGVRISLVVTGQVRATSKRSA